ncbi:MAG: hypothetical protein H0W02_18830 [Ktedonobacteraceae bacterium]|nr:hypothetical protein [Ktedonobacteraceae bacterium]
MQHFDDLSPGEIAALLRRFIDERVAAMAEHRSYLNYRQRKRIATITDVRMEREYEQDRNLIEFLEYLEREAKKAL